MHSYTFKLLVESLVEGKGELTVIVTVLHAILGVRFCVGIIIIPQTLK